MKKELALTFMLALAFTACKRSKKDPQSYTQRTKKAQEQKIEETKKIQAQLAKEKAAQAAKDLQIKALQADLENAKVEEVKVLTSDEMKIQNCQVEVLESASTLLAEKAMAQTGLDNVTIASLTEIKDNISPKCGSEMNCLIEANNKLINILDKNNNKAIDEELSNKTDQAALALKVKLVALNGEALPETIDESLKAIITDMSSLVEEESGKHIISNLAKCDTINEPAKEEVLENNPNTAGDNDLTINQYDVIKDEVVDIPEVPEEIIEVTPPADEIVTVTELTDVGQPEEIIVPADENNALNAALENDRKIKRFKRRIKKHEDHKVEADKKFENKKVAVEAANQKKIDKLDNRKTKRLGREDKRINRNKTKIEKRTEVIKQKLEKRAQKTSK